MAVGVRFAGSNGARAAAWPQTDVTATEDTRNYEDTTRPSTDKTPDLSWKHVRLSLRSRISFPKR